MDRTDKLISNRAPKRLLLLYAVMLAVAFFTGYLSAELLADSFTGMQIDAMLSAAGSTAFDAQHFTRYPSDEAIAAGEELLSKYGIYSAMNPELMECRQDMRNLIWVAVSVPMAAIASIWLFVSIRQLFNLYDKLEALRLDCLKIAALKLDSTVTSKSDCDCAGRLAAGVALVSERMNYLADTLKNDKELLKEFLSDFSHQLKTSLAVIRLNNDMLLEMENLTPQKKKMLSEEIEEHLCCMEELITSALKLARLNSNAVEYIMKDEDISETCRIAASRITPLLREKNIAINTDSLCSCMLSHDRVWLCEAFENIIKNSADHSGCSVIRLSTESTPTSVTVIISDNGKGIPQSELPSIFERFGKRRNSISMSSSGLGMSIARKITDAHGGEILVYSEQGSGTRFEIVFLK